METPTREEMERGIAEFEKWFGRDAMYNTSLCLLNHFWGKPAKMADAVGVLLLTWNQRFYLAGLFDFEALETCIGRNLKIIKTFRDRSILDYTFEDDAEIKRLFGELLDVLAIAKGMKKNGREGQRTPVQGCSTLIT